ncbi:MAG: MAPEG family protein [Alphaproteobacteria bacterium]|nr:MAPEG family protein [Alphaproteobacteria bacterium]
MNEPLPAAAPLPTGVAEGFELNIFGWPWTGLVTLLALLIVFVLALQVSRARKIYGVPSPLCTGPDDFMRVLYVHVHAVKCLVLFLPLLWMTAFATKDEIAAAIGVFWPLSAISYALAYYKDAKKGSAAITLGVVVLVILFAVSAIQIVRSLFIW